MFHFTLQIEKTKNFIIEYFGNQKMPNPQKKRTYAELHSLEYMMSFDKIKRRAQKEENALIPSVKYFLKNHDLSTELGRKLAFEWYSSISKRFRQELRDNMSFFIGINSINLFRKWENIIQCRLKREKKSNNRSTSNSSNKINSRDTVQLSLPKIDNTANESQTIETPQNTDIMRKKKQQKEGSN